MEKVQNIDENGNTEPGSSEDEFEPTDEMMVSDSDDEDTLDEEEAMDLSNELSNLKIENNMPLEALLATHGFFNDNESDGDDGTSGGETSEEENGPEEADTTAEAANVMRQRRSGSRPQKEDKKEDNRKMIMVGSDYQAQIPDGLRKYDESLPYENEDKLLWNPGQCNDDDLVNYMVSVKTANESAAAGGDRIIIPQGSHVRDDEQALYLLLQSGHNYDKALRRNRRSSRSSSPNVATITSVWSEEEYKNFETGFKDHGKDFHKIQENNVGTRTLGELVQFYYLWKKPKLRGVVQANKSKPKKKKYTPHPGTSYLEYSDLLENLQDE